jgi:hypothetical protein
MNLSPDSSIQFQTETTTLRARDLYILKLEGQAKKQQYQAKIKATTQQKPIEKMRIYKICTNEQN